MPNFFVIDAKGQKRGPFDDQQLKALAAKGRITPTTSLETEGGHKGTADQIPGLFPVTSVSPVSTLSPPSTPNQLCCTNCGSPVPAQSFGCMSCGLVPTGHKKFCRQCGGAIVNPKQVVCVQCGAVLRGGTATRTKSKWVAGLLGIFLGPFGVHKYYMGSWGWGLVYTVFVFCTCFYGGVITGIIGLIEGILYLTMSDEAFAEKYPPETQSAFRW